MPLTKHDKPFWTLDTVRVLLRVTKLGDIDGVGLVDLILRAVTNEHGLSTPLDDSVLALGNAVHVHLDLGQSQHIAGSAHGGQEVRDGGLGAAGGNETHGADHEVREDLVGVLVLGTVRRKVRDLGGVALGGLEVLGGAGEVARLAETERVR